MYGDELYKGDVSAQLVTANKKQTDAVAQNTNNT
jgi:hypothetical protein